MINNTKSATRILAEATFEVISAVINAIKANNIDNGIVRDIKMFHGNLTPETLPDYAKAAFDKAVIDAMNKIYSNGFKVVPKD